MDFLDHVFVSSAPGSNAENNQQGRDIQRNQNEQQRAKDEISRSQECVTRLSFVCKAMWSLMKEHTELTDDDLENMIAEIQLQEIEDSARSCPKCARPVRGDRATCLYCGEKISQGQPAPFNQSPAHALQHDG